MAKQNTFCTSIASETVNQNNCFLLTMSICSTQEVMLYYIITGDTLFSYYSIEELSSLSTDSNLCISMAWSELPCYTVFTFNQSAEGISKLYYKKGWKSGLLIGTIFCFPSIFYSTSFNFSKLQEGQYFSGEAISHLVIVGTKIILCYHHLYFPTPHSSVKKRSPVLPNFWEGMVYSYHVARSCPETKSKDLAEALCIAS